MMPRDAALVQLVDAAMTEAVRKSGAWVVCKPGCTPCCMGTFPITQLDALRLQDGLRELHREDPDRAARVSERARQSRTRLEREREDAAEDEPCPALDPATGLCDLYAARPITCRTFGPAVRWGSDAVGACELCYTGATDAQIAQCGVEIDPDGLEDRLLAELEDRGETVVAFALTASPTAPNPDPDGGPPRS